MKNYIAPGTVLDLTAPAGGVISGGLYRIGVFVGVAGASAAAGDKFPLGVRGVFSAPTDTGAAWAEGDALYFDPNAGVLTKTATATKIGGAVTAKLAGDVRSIVYLAGGIG